MYPFLTPWTLFLAPRFYFPWSGDVVQRIDPETNWFSREIRPEAGDANTEQAAFQVASYGRQLGLITEVLDDLATQMNPTTSEGTQALNRLRGVKQRIEALKAEGLAVDGLVEQAQGLRETDPAAYREFAKRLGLEPSEPPPVG
ncbi:MAG: hypothetical protein ACPGUC_03185 [Gammaproteobacteria bacterium]